MRWRRAKAAKTSLDAERIVAIDPDERRTRDAAAASARFVEQRVNDAPFHVWFPGDETGTRGSWVPSFFTFGRRKDDV